MKHPDNQFSIEEVERLCQLYQDCQLTVLEETELEYVLMHCCFDSPVVKETVAMMAVSRSVKLAESKKLHKPVWAWAMRVAACAAIAVLALGIYLHYDLKADDDCIVYVAGERASDKVAHEIAESDIAKMQRFMQTVNEHKALEQAKVEQFMNHINQSK